MKKATKAVLIGICLSLIIIVFSYLNCYPITINETGKTIVSFYPLLWPALSISFFSIVILINQSNNKLISLLLTVYYIILFTLPSFFYWCQGSDSGGGFAGLVQYMLSNNTITGNYAQWPAFLVYISIINLFTALPLNLLLKVSMIGIILVYVSNLFVFYDRQEGESKFGVIVYFIAFYLFLNWQPVPQVFGLAIFFVLLNLLKNDCRFLLLLIIAFISLVSSHAFVSIWFVFFILLSTIYETIRSNNGYLKTLLLLLFTIQLSYMLYLAPEYFKNLILSLNSEKLSVIKDQLAYKELITYGTEAITSETPTIINLIIKTIAQLNIIILWVTLNIGLITSIKNKKISVTSIFLFVTGCLHFILGSFVQILGFRGLQLSSISLAGQYPSTNFKFKYYKLAFIIILFVSLLLPTNLIRVNYENTQYITNSDIIGFDFMSQHTKNNTFNTLLTIGNDAGYLAESSHKFIPNGASDYYGDNAFNTSNHILYSAKFTTELSKYSHSIEIEEANLTLNPKFKKIYDSGNQRWYTRL